MRKGRILLYVLIPILLIVGGWGIFNSVIRPRHYQLLFPYSIFHSAGLAVTETRMGRDGRLQIRTWTDKDGGKHERAEIHIENAYFGDNGKKEV